MKNSNEDLIKEIFYPKESNLFNEVMEIYKSLDDFDFRSSTEDVRYEFIEKNHDPSVYTNPIRLFANNTNKINPMHLIYRNRFFDIINEDSFEEMLHQLDERLFLTLNEMVFIVEDSDVEYIREKHNVEFDEESIGIYNGETKLAIVNLRAILAFTLDDSYSRDNYYRLAVKTLVSTIVTGLASFNYDVHRLPDKFRVAGLSFESVDLYGRRIYETLNKNMVLNIIKSEYIDFLCEEVFYCDDEDE